MHVVDVSSSSFTVELSPASHAKSYRLYASPVRSNLYARNLSAAQRSGVSRQPRLTIRNLAQPGGQYYYRVEAMNRNRLKYSTVTGPIGLRPAPPAHLRAESNTTQTYVSWSGTSASSYQIEQATSPDMSSGQRFYRVRGGANEFTPYGLAQGRKYYFRVRSVNGSTPSNFSGTTQTVVQSAQQHVRVMTYNVKEAHFDGEHEGGNVVAPWMSERRPAAAALISQASPDVVGVEEAATLIGHHRRQIDTLRKSLGGGYGLARTEIPPKDPGTHRTGNYILFKKSTWKPVGKGGHWALGDRHTAAHQVLRSRDSGAKFLFVVAHLWQGVGGSSDVMRKHETQVLVQKAHALAARRGVPVVYAGDFNSDSAGHEFNAPAEVMKQHHIADSFNVAQRRARSNYNTANHYMRRPPHHGLRIDYVFAPQGVGVASWRLIMHLHGGEYAGTIPSDHNPVASDLMIPYHR
jgi:endonuclease/exonuclease/phosphatase family metal-dependent hydrolase